ncbi:MAG: hypothetical protein V3W14_11925 [Candidatus Neomarinimicrobiota bacterium]
MWSRIKDFFRIYWRSIVIVTSIAALVAVGLMLKIDAKIIAIFAVVAGLITNGFVALATLTSLIPLVGPLLVKLLSLPIFWLLNTTGYFASLVAIKKGYRAEVINNRLLTIILLIGVLIGYILGNLLPVG